MKALPRCPRSDLAGINAILLLLATSGLLLTNAEKFWWLAPVISGIAAILVFWFNSGRHKWRAKRMKHPFDIYLTLAPEKGRDSWCREIHVPPHTEIPIQLRVLPRFHFRQDLFIFGFDGDETRRPQPLRVFNHFIKVGIRREQSPGTDENHTIDYSDNYHIKERVERVHPNCYAYGFMVRTREPGRYPVRIEAITDCGEGIPLHKLVVIVEERQLPSASLFASE